MNIALFASGSSGNCALVSDGDTHILLDAGISARRIRAGLSAQDVTADALTGVLVTHEHSDHVKGLAVLLRHDSVPVYALPAVCAALRAQLPAECLHEIAPDAPDWDEYEAEQERACRHRKKLAAIYDRDERFREEKEIEDAGN